MLWSLRHYHTITSSRERSARAQGSYRWSQVWVLFLNDSFANSPEFAICHHDSCFERKPPPFLCASTHVPRRTFTLRAARSCCTLHVHTSALRENHPLFLCASTHIHTPRRTFTLRTARSCCTLHVHASRSTFTLHTPHSKPHAPDFTLDTPFGCLAPRSHLTRDDKSREESCSHMKVHPRVALSHGSSCTW